MNVRLADKFRCLLSLLGNMYELNLTEEVEDRRPAEVFRK